MKLKKLSRYFYRKPIRLLRGAFIVSAAMHGALFLCIPLIRASGLPAVKGDIIFINVSLNEIEMKSKSNIAVSKPEEIEKKEVEFKEDPDSLLPMPKEEKKETEPVMENKFVPPPPSISKEIIVKARKRYEDYLLERIHKAKFYPMEARRMEQEGVVRVKFVLSKEGALISEVNVISPCRYPVLNDAAQKIVYAAAPFPEFPPEMREQERIFTLDINFNLEIW
jgi:TonB family protein